MKLEIDPVENHRGREAKRLVYPVYSRRSGGLSVGINLFPREKVCSFDCPYCEVFPFQFEPETVFDRAEMAESLVSVLETAKKDGVPVKDICFSGSGEPSISPFFQESLEKVIGIRNSLVPGAAIVLITNGTGLFDAGCFDFLVKKALEGLDVWLKIDAATPEWFKKINSPRQAVDFALLTEKIRAFAEKAPFISQTMICKISGAAAPDVEERAWVKLVTRLAAPGNLRLAQIYGKARPGPADPLAEALDVSFLNKRAGALRTALDAAGLSVPVEVFL